MGKHRRGKADDDEGRDPQEDPREEAEVVVRGRYVSQADAAEFAAVKAFLSPEKAFERVQSHAKWLFATVSVVGTLGVGVSSGLTGSLSQRGQLVFAVAVALLALSLACAALSLSPKWEELYRASRESVVGAMDSALGRRRKWILAASFLFAVALVLAGTAPIVSGLERATAAPRPRAVLTYELDRHDSLTAKLEGRGLPRFAVGEIEMRRVADSTAEVIALARGMADSTGDLTLTLPKSQVAGAGHWLLGRWQQLDESGEGRVERADSIRVGG